MRHLLSALAAMLALTAPSPAAPPPPSPRPNVLVLLADDQGWGDLSVHGNTNLRTPHLDSLARDGALFEHFYVCPVCSPTRAEFLTGRYHPRGGVRDVTTGGERLDLAERTLPELFHAAGYATALFGKWHNGTQYPYHPLGRGFTEFYGFTSGHWGDYFSPPLDHNGRPTRGQGYLPDDLTDHALAFLDRHQDKPFFCYVAFNTPHSPMQVPDAWWDRFRDAPLPRRWTGPGAEDLATTRAALAMCENLDHNAGRLLRRLQERGLERRTLVLFFSDNGPNSARWNGGLRGRKGSTDEGGTRSPLLVRWPGVIPAGRRVRPVAAAIDLLPTLADLAGVPTAGTRPLDGASLAPLLRGGPETEKAWPERTLFSHWAGQVSARTDRYRLDAQGRLYDMAADPGQARDLAADPGQARDVADRLREQVRRWRKDVGVDRLRGPDPRPFPVGYRAFPVTELPPRDGVPRGGIRRSAAAPNCSFFTGWTSPEGSVAWDVEVATPGRYEAAVAYTCPPAHLGAVLELRLGDRHVAAAVTQAHDPPLAGADHDRVPRKGESPMKDFRPLRLGVLELPRGRGLLTLRAAKVPGPGVVDVGGVTLTLLPEPAQP